MFALFQRTDESWPWVYPAVIVSACVFISAVALVSQYVGGHHPCTLCIAQRTSYVVAAIVAGAAAYIGRDDQRSAERIMLLGVCSLAFLYGSVTAFEHIGVEQGWWSGTLLCDGAMTGFGIDLDGQRLGANPLFSVPEMTCAQGTWTLFNLSMATYNLLANFAMMVFSAAVALIGLQAARRA